MRTPVAHDAGRRPPIRNVSSHTGRGCHLSALLADAHIRQLIADTHVGEVFCSRSWDDSNPQFDGESFAGFRSRVESQDDFGPSLDEAGSRFRPKSVPS